MESDDFLDEIRRKRTRRSTPRNRRVWKYTTAFVILGTFFVLAAVINRSEENSRFWELLISGLLVYGLGVFCFFAVRPRPRKSRSEDGNPGVAEMIGERIGEEFSSQVYGLLGESIEDESFSRARGGLGGAWDEPESVRRKYPKLGDIVKDMSVGKIPGVIDMLGSRSELQRKNAHLTLCLYTCRDYGEDVAAWRRWYEASKDKEPAEWWAGSLREKGYDTNGLALEEQIPVLVVCMVEEENPYVRYAAERLLSHLTGTKVLYSHDGSEKLRRWQLKKWKAGYDRRRKLREKRPGKGG